MSERLPSSVRAKILGFPECTMGTHLVTLVLKDGSKKKNLIVVDGAEIWGVESGKLGFSASDVVDAIHQAWTESTGEKPWWDPENKDWWKS
jgi:hypothetical protein